MKVFTAQEVALVVSKAQGAAEKAALKYFNEVLNGRDQYACGFAYATIYNVKGSTKLGRALLANGFRKAYGGGLQFWMPGRTNVQNVDVHEAGARAFAQVIKDELEVDCYAGSHLD